jgi:hypothetical protein
MSLTLSFAVYREIVGNFEVCGITCQSILLRHCFDVLTSDASNDVRRDPRAVFGTTLDVVPANNGVGTVSSVEFTGGAVVDLPVLVGLDFN